MTRAGLRFTKPGRISVLPPMTSIFPPSRAVCGLFWVTLFCLFGLGCQPSQGDNSSEEVVQGGVEVFVLGTAQDAGLPHIGCTKANCERARAEGRREKVSCLAIRGQTGWWLLDATPDFADQIQAMQPHLAAAGLRAESVPFQLPTGVFLTHAHIGHYTGLMYLGREALGANAVPLWCGERLAEFMRNNGPWDQLLVLGQVELNGLRPNQTVELEPGLTLTPIPVPHRDEYSNTFGFHVEHQDGGALLFIPDIDQWHKWDRDLADFLQPGTTLLIDGTFYSGDELPHRDLREIPHPLVSSTMDLLEQSPALTGEDEWPFRVGFIHLNHSNPLWDRESTQYRDLQKRGFFVADQGMRISLSQSHAP